MVGSSIELACLNKAITSLEMALEALKQDGENEFIRDACILRFKCCKELLSKLEARILNNEVVMTAFAD